MYPGLQKRLSEVWNKKWGTTGEQRAVPSHSLQSIGRHLLQNSVIACRSHALALCPTLFIVQSFTRDSGLILLQLMFEWSSTSYNANGKKAHWRRTVIPLKSGIFPFTTCVAHWLARNFTCRNNTIFVRKGHKQANNDPGYTHLYYTLNNCC